MFITSTGDELFFREGNTAEDLAGVFSTTAGSVATFLGGDAVIQHGDYQLGIPLQTNEGELTQGNKKSALFVAQHQIFVEIFPDTLGNLCCQLRTAAVTDFPHFGTENHRIQNLHHSGGAVGTGTAGAVRSAQTGVGGEDMGAAVLTA
jgi:hypothetical protein